MNTIACIRGALSPVVTRFCKDLTPDRHRLAAHCRRLASRKCGLALFGTNGEASSQCVDERMELLKAVVEGRIDPSTMSPAPGIAPCLTV